MGVSREVVSSWVYFAVTALGYVNSLGEESV